MPFKFNPITGELDLVGSGGSGSASDSFTTIQPTAGTTPVADSSTDTLTLTSTDGSVVITGNSTTDTLNFAALTPIEKSIFLEVPIIKTYTLIQSSKVAFTLTTFTYAMASGTLTCKIQIDGVDVTGLTALSASSTPATATATAAKTVSIGSKVTLVVSAVSSTQDFTASLGGTT